MINKTILNGQPKFQHYSCEYKTLIQSSEIFVDKCKFKYINKFKCNVKVGHAFIYFLHTDCCRE